MMWRRSICVASLIMALSIHAEVEDAPPEGKHHGGRHHPSPPSVAPPQPESAPQNASADDITAAEHGPHAGKHHGGKRHPSPPPPPSPRASPSPSPPPRSPPSPQAPAEDAGGGSTFVGYNTCASAAYTRPGPKTGGRNCNGWSGVSIQECRQKCEASRHPGCLNEWAKSAQCNFFVYYPRNKWCHLHATCPLGKQSHKYELVYAMNRPPAASPPPPMLPPPTLEVPAATAVSVTKIDVANGEAVAAFEGHANGHQGGRHHGGRHHPAPPAAPPAAPVVAKSR